MLTASRVAVFCGSNLLEESIQRRRVLPRRTPHDFRGGVVRDEGQVAVVFPPGNLVHPNIDQAFKAGLIELFGNDAFADRPDSPPRDPGERGDGGLVRTGDQPGDHVLKVRAEAGAVPCERHALNHDPMNGAEQAPAQHREHYRPAGEVHMPPR